MPIYHYACECGAATSKIRTAKAEAERPHPPCGGCGCPMGRVVGGGVTATVKEVLDNGLMRKRVERLRDAERIFTERSKLSPDRGE